MRIARRGRDDIWSDSLRASEYSSSSKTKLRLWGELCILARIIQVSPMRRISLSESLEVSNNPGRDLLYSILMVRNNMKQQNKNSCVLCVIGIKVQTPSSVGKQLCANALFPHSQIHVLRSVLVTGNLTARYTHIQCSQKRIPFIFVWLLQN